MVHVELDEQPQVRQVMVESEKMPGAGPTFLSTINYLIPVVAFLCGAWLLAEPVTWLHILALVAILGGIAVTRIRVRKALP